MRSNLSLAVLLVALAIGCGKKQSEAPVADQETTNRAVAAATDEAQAMFKTVCATCHGESGLGNGPGAAALNPKPRNYTDKSWQATVTDDQIRQTILMGGAAVGKSPVMPAQPQLKEKPEVVAALVKIIRTFGR
jgi:cytochrome c553